MGLDTTHNAWHGAYSAFHRWRTEIARAAGLPPLTLMEGFYFEDDVTGNPFKLLDYKFPNGNELEMFQLREIRKSLPIKWNSLKKSPLHILLLHSDCDGYITWRKCKKIAEELAKILDKLPEGEGGGHIGNWKEKTQTFIDGCMAAHSAKENLEFH